MMDTVPQSTENRAPSGCAICKTPLPPQLDLCGNVVDNGILLCHDCKPTNGEVVLITVGRVGAGTYIRLSPTEAKELEGYDTSKRVIPVQFMQLRKIAEDFITPELEEEIEEYQRDIENFEEGIAEREDWIDECKHGRICHGKPDAKELRAMRKSYAKGAEHGRE